MTFFPKEHIVRQIKTDEPNVYLTFDDGPCEFTLQVLDVLAQYQAKATFFVIGQNAEKYPSIISRIQQEGHSIYSHSVDRNYLNYFKSDKAVSQWISHSLDQLETLIGQKNLAFRPPAGIINPPVARSSAALQVRLILWNYRFFDSIFELTFKKISKYLSQAQKGDIVLLHDAQKLRNQDSFLKSLVFLITELQLKNLKLEKLNL